MEIRDNFEGDKMPQLMKVMLDCLYQSICHHTKMRQILNGVMSHSQMLGKFEYTLPAKF